MIMTTSCELRDFNSKSNTKKKRKEKRTVHVYGFTKSRTYFKQILANFVQTIYPF